MVRWQLGIFIGVITLLIVFSKSYAVHAQEQSMENVIVGQDRSISARGDAENGRRVFYRCRACHHLREGRQAVGPSLNALFGREAGSLKSYDRYSRTLLDADFVWTEERLNEWLANPNSFLPGNKMTFAGISSPEERRDLISYLRRVTEPDSRDDATR